MKQIQDRVKPDPQWTSFTYKLDMKQNQVGLKTDLEIYFIDV
jgi:hypothetical protein